MQFKIIETSSPKWDEVVKNAFSYDFHHTSFFHNLDTSFEGRLLLFSYQDSFIALPIVIRPIEGTSYYDVTSVYGYAGPVFYFANEKTKQDLIMYFQKTFMEFCNDEHIISVFSRLHPLIEQEDILRDLGEVVYLNKTVSIDLTLSPEMQRKEYRKSLKSDLNRLAKLEVEVINTNDSKDIDAFIAIYYETMDRVDATDNYYFSEDYFHHFLNNDAFASQLLLAKQGGKVIAGAIFTQTEKIMQYHLAGTTEEFIKEAPMKLILDKARLLGNETTALNLHLGGGVGGHDDDSLFRFKSGFSKNLKQFSVWKFITNKDIYRELSKGKEQSDFFPLYRS